MVTIYQGTFSCITTIPLPHVRNSTVKQKCYLIVHFSLTGPKMSLQTFVFDLGSS